MYQIDVDFDVWKALTSMRMSERHTYNDVLRSLLNLESAREAETELSKLECAVPNAFRDARKGFHSRGLFLPDGTELRAIYKGKAFTAQIANGKWIDAKGTSFTSPSAAASAITGNNVNGLRFWEGRLPSSQNWCRLDLLS
ncbi:MAG: DUF4357 domain-containing protein [Sphingomonadales bacterium]|nr:DUF4357 domain-containing protein [Sphingomonadales bacterium]